MQHAHLQARIAFPCRFCFHSSNNRNVWRNYSTHIMSYILYKKYMYQPPSRPRYREGLPSLAVCAACTKARNNKTKLPYDQNHEIRYTPLPENNRIFRLLNMNTEKKKRLRTRLCPKLEGTFGCLQTKTVLTNANWPYI